MISTTPYGEGQFVALGAELRQGCPHTLEPGKFEQVLFHVSCLIQYHAHLRHVAFKMAFAQVCLQCVQDLVLHVSYS